tara:strand:- start:781 stop:1110 length:330 start_codon:yes stop_codon:yes gene_type:complete
MEDKKTYYTEDLVKNAIEDLEERLKWNKENEYDQDTDDLIHETADNNVPIYTYDLLQYASNNFDLIQPNELTSNNPDVIQIIQANIYEYLTDKLYNYINTEITIKTQGE